MKNKIDDASGDGFAVMILLLTTGIGCVAYEYVPFYGATPLILGLWFLALCFVPMRWFRR